MSNPIYKIWLHVEKTTGDDHEDIGMPVSVGAEFSSENVAVAVRDASAEQITKGLEELKWVTEHTRI